MDIEYLYSVINLYLKNEKDGHRTNLNIQKVADRIKFHFNMNEKDINKTTINLSIEDVSPIFGNILISFKKNLMIIDEKYDKKKGHYSILFKNGRLLSFDGFSLVEINNIRNILYDIKLRLDEFRLDAINNEAKMAYKPDLILQQTGFASNTTLFLVALYLTDAFLIALLFFKVLTK